MSTKKRFQKGSRKIVKNGAKKSAQKSSVTLQVPKLVPKNVFPQKKCQIKQYK